MDCLNTSEGHGIIMIPLFATLKRGEAEAVRAGRIPLSSINPVHSIASGASDSVCVSNEITPPMPGHVVIEIIHDISDADLCEHIVPIVDQSETIYQIPRAWLVRATCRLVADEEILAFCVEQLDYIVPPGQTTLRSSLRQSIKSGDEEYFSPYYIKAFKATTSPTIQQFPDHRCVYHFEGGVVYVAERDGHFYVILDESTMADLLDEGDAEGLDVVKVLEFDTDADREAYLASRFRRPSSG